MTSDPSPKQQGSCTHSGEHTHTKFKLDRTRRSGIIVFTSKISHKNHDISQNHPFFLSFDPIRPWICTKNNRVPVLILGNTHTKFKLDRTKIPKIAIFLSVDPKRPWICTKNNRVHVLIMGNTHTPSLNLIGPGSLDLSCLRAYEHNFPKFHKISLFAKF